LAALVFSVKENRLAGAKHGQLRLNAYPQVNLERFTSLHVGGTALVSRPHREVYVAIVIEPLHANAERPVHVQEVHLAFPVLQSDREVLVPVPAFVVGQPADQAEVFQGLPEREVPGLEVDDAAFALILRAEVGDQLHLVAGLLAQLGHDFANGLLLHADVDAGRLDGLDLFEGAGQGDQVAANFGVFRGPQRFFNNGQNLRPVEFQALAGGIPLAEVVMAELRNQAAHAAGIQLCLRSERLFTHCGGGNGPAQPAHARSTHDSPEQGEVAEHDAVSLCQPRSIPFHCIRRQRRLQQPRPPRRCDRCVRYFRHGFRRGISLCNR